MKVSINHFFLFHLFKPVTLFSSTIIILTQGGTCALCPANSGLVRRCLLSSAAAEGRLAAAQCVCVAGAAGAGVRALFVCVRALFGGVAAGPIAVGRWVGHASGGDGPQ